MSLRLLSTPGSERNVVVRAPGGHRRLLEVPGIGPWTAGYIRMRALGDPDVFLATDLGVRQGMARAGLAFDEARATEAAADRWRPWRSYAQLHIWSLLDQPMNKER